MGERSLRSTSPPTAARRSRRGAIGVLLLVSVVAALAIAALVINLGWVYCHHHKLQSACEAAALAGAAELMDDSHLYGFVPGDRGDDEGPHQRRIRRAKQQAARLAAANGVALDLGEDEEDEESGAVTTVASLDARVERRSRAKAAAVATGEVIVWAGSPNDERVQGDERDPMAPRHGATQLRGEVWHVAPRQGMIVRAGREKRRGNPLAFWLGGVTGITRGDAVAEAGAVLDQRVYGFRPAGHVEVPLVPIALSATDDSTGRFWGVLRSVAADDPRTPSGEPVRDAFSVDFRSAEVSNGPDGIPEVVLKIRAPDPSKSEQGGEQTAWVVSLSGPHWIPLVFDLQTRDGLRREDLDFLGGEIALGNAGTLVLPGPRLQKSQLGQIREALASIRGQRRAWMLGDSAGESVEIVGFVAGCVVDCQLESDSCLAVAIEPCVLETCTALVGGVGQLNPFLGKVMLER